MSRSVVHALLLIGIPALGNAQPAYRFGPDTLRYDERTDSRSMMRIGAGAVTIVAEHEATLGVVLQPAAKGWYERLRIRQEGPPGRVQNPATDAILNQAFRFQFTSRGQAETTSVPEFPAEVAAMTDLSRQFDDFFVSLPGVPLAVGVEWSDTVLRTNPRKPGQSYRSHHVRRYRVERDTVAGNQPAFVVRVVQKVVVDASSPMEGRGVATTHLEGEEFGTAVLAADGSRLLARERDGTLSGTLGMPGPSGTISIPQSYTYRSVLRLKTP